MENGQINITLTLEQFNQLSVSVSSHIFSLMGMCDETGKDKYFNELKRVQELKNILILTKRSLVVSK